MPLVATRGAASAQGFGEFAQSAAPVYIEDVFSTWLYTGNNSTQVINNGIDLAGKGGLVWLKRRNAATSHVLSDSARGLGSSVYRQLFTNLTSAQNSTTTEGISSFGSGGFTLTTGSDVNALNNPYVSWTFREQPKFFDVVTWTGNNVNGRQITHNLGSTPGCIIVKSTSLDGTDWVVHHRSLGFSQVVYLNSTAAAETTTRITAATSTTFTISDASTLNSGGATYVAYLFAHDAGGFGLSGTDNVISCGSYTGNGSTSGPVINLGYEPQWILIRNATQIDNWVMFDNMRGLSMINDALLLPNTSDNESSSDRIAPTATGFTPTVGTSIVNGNGQTYIYIAIRRGPMKTPTTGTSVYTSAYGTGSSNPAWISGFPVDFSVDANIGGGSTDEKNTGSRLLQGTYGVTNTTAAWAADASKQYAFQNGFQTTNNGSTDFAWMFRRAPSFMDVVCYSGTGVANTQAHNLGVVPELMIVKPRSTTGFWRVYSATLGNAQGLSLNAIDGAYPAGTYWNTTTPTSTSFSVNATATNASGTTYVNYLFASCPGVSRVGSYTGTGATQVINCGFTGGARFVLIKATSTTGNWMVWDSTRGIVAGNDPFVVWNDNLGETTGTDWVDTAATGFELSNNAGNLANSNGVSYIFLAIA